MVLAVVLLFGVFTMNYYGNNNGNLPTLKSNVTETTTTPQTTESKSRNKEVSEMRGVWVTYMEFDMNDTDRSFNSFKNKFNKIVEVSKENKFNTLIVQVRPFSDALYNSKIFPTSHILAGKQGEKIDYDALSYMCEYSHKNNMKIHAWINPYRISLKETPKNLADNNPYVLDKSLGVETDSGIFYNPANKKAQELIVNGVKEIVENYDVDGIQFDDYFYPTKDKSFDQREYSQYLKAQSNKGDTLSKWRMKNVNNLIKSTYKAVHSVKDNVDFGVSPQGNIKNNSEIFADVKTWCSKENYIDYICPQLYYSLDNPALSYEDGIDSWLKIKTNENVKIYSGLAGYKAGDDEYDSGTWQDFNDILMQEYEIAKSKKYNGIMLYSYSSLTDKNAEKEVANLVMKLE